MQRTRSRILTAIGTDIELLRPHMSEVRIRPGQVLCEPGEPIDFVHFLHSGVVSKLTSFEDGAEIECALIGRDGAIGVMSALGVRTAVTRDICHIEARASRAPVAALAEAARRSQRIHDMLDRYCAWKMSSVIRCGACNACHSVEQRLCRWLLTCLDVLETDEIRLPQEVFASMLGVQRTSINPVLRGFQSAGLIATGRGRVTVTDRHGLQHRACECYAALKRAEQATWASFADVRPGAPQAARSAARP